MDHKRDEEQEVLLKINETIEKNTKLSLDIAKKQIESILKNGIADDGGEIEDGETRFE